MNNGPPRRRSAPCSSARDAEQATRQRLAELERALAEAQQGLRDAESVAAALDARRSALQDEATRQHRAPARLEQALKDGELSGAIGRLGAYVHPEASLRAAVMAALGESALGFVFRDQQARGRSPGLAGAGVAHRAGRFAPAGHAGHAAGPIVGRRLPRQRRGSGSAG